MRRLFWMLVGASLGLYGRSRAQKTMNRYVPPAVTDKVGSSVKTFVGDVARAQSEARRYLKKKS